MDLFGDNFRKWWQYPRPTGDRSVHRTVTFLELFYDLIYVVVIARLAHHLAGHVDWSGFLGYLFLFFIVWWSWFNGMSYHDIHGNDDIRTRVFTFLQMICVAGMAVFAHDALGETASQFSIAYGLFQLTLWYLWWRVGVHDPVHRVLSRPYSAGFFVATVLFLVAAFVPAEVRWYLWGASIVISFLLPAYLFSIGRNNPVAQTELDKMMIVSPSMVERFGLLTIIVLGEVVVGAVSGLAGHHHFTVEVGIIGLLGILVAVGLLINQVDSGSDAHDAVHRRGRNALVGSAVATAIVGLLPLSPIPTLLLIVLFLLAPIYFAVSVWVERYDEVAASEGH
ncbi:MAG: low temperature requirement protein A [Chloroflexota bacterium]